MRDLLIQVGMPDRHRETIGHILRDFHVFRRESRDLVRAQIQRADQLAIGQQGNRDNRPDSVFFECDPRRPPGDMSEVGHDIRAALPKVVRIAKQIQGHPRSNPQGARAQVVLLPQ